MPAFMPFRALSKVASPTFACHWALQFHGDRENGVPVKPPKWSDSNQLASWMPGAIHQKFIRLKQDTCGGFKGG